MRRRVGRLPRANFHNKLMYTKRRWSRKETCGTLIGSHSTNSHLAVQTQILTTHRSSWLISLLCSSISPAPATWKDSSSATAAFSFLCSRLGRGAEHVGGACRRGTRRDNLSSQHVMDEARHRARRTSEKGSPLPRCLPSCTKGSLEESVIAAAQV